jgi:cytoskeleton protein RodZ
MSEQGSQNQNAETSAANGSPPAVHLLRLAREAQGLHMGALAVALKVPVKKLEALEAGRFDELPDMMFARALALSICRVLKIDSAPIMASLPEQQVNPFKSTETGLNTTFKESTGGANRAMWSHVTRPMGLGVVLLLLVILAVVLWPTVPAIESASVNSSGRLTGADQNVPVSIASMGSSLPEPSAAQVAASAAEGSVTENATPGTVVQAVANEGAISLPETAAQTALLEFAAHGVSWVEVFDAAGKPKLRKLTADGDVLRVTGQLPLSVVVGRADQISVMVRGKPLDIAPMAKENVARFEVK